MSLKKEDKSIIKQGVKKNIMYYLLESIASILGGALVFVCAYWFFHFDTWHERFIYISISIAAVYLFCKVLPNRPD